jgi:hypothetical protein
MEGLGVTGLTSKDDLKAFANGGHARVGLTPYTLACTAKESFMDLAPIRERAIAFALNGSELFGDLIVRNDIHLGSLDDTNCIASEVRHDTQVARARQPLFLVIVNPQQRCGCTFLASQYQAGELVRAALVVVEVEGFKKTRAGIDGLRLSERVPELGVGDRNFHVDA